MESYAQALHHTQQTFFQELDQVATLEELEALRVAYLGRKGSIPLLLRQLSGLTLSEKQEYGPRLQELHRSAQAACDEKRAQLDARTSQASAARPIDVTAYRAAKTTGGLHPYTHIIERIEDIFVSLGWSLVTGPEVEDEFHNFEALNIPEQHPARDIHDTFWLTLPHRLLRTHTSSVQIRTLEKTAPPLAICATGRTFRHEATDATHDMTFMQCEGLFIDRSVSLTHLIGTLTLFMRQLFETEQLQVRVLPDYFPFVEPGLTVLVSCLFCKTGCSICKKTGWIELGGAGMVHPHVLRACALNPEEWSGFAFGFGIERIAMLMFKINDIRLLKTSKLTVLRQFALSSSS